MNKISSKDDYVHGAEAPCSNSYLQTPIKDILQTLNVHRVMDIGCGNGTLCNLLNNSDITGGGGNVELIGIEPSTSGIEHAKQLVPNAKFYCMGIYDDPAKIEESNFDAIISTEVIEHLFYPRELLRFAKAKLKPTGYILLTTPYHGYLKNLMLSLFNKWDKHHTPLWDGGHIKFWSKNTLSQLMQEEGFEIKQFVGCGRIPYMWKSMLLVGQLKP